MIILENWVLLVLVAYLIKHWRNHRHYESVRAHLGNQIATLKWACSYRDINNESVDQWEQQQWLTEDRDVVVVILRSFWAGRSMTLKATVLSVAYRCNHSVKGWCQKWCVRKLMWDANRVLTRPGTFTMRRRTGWKSDLRTVNEEIRFCYPIMTD